MSRHLLASHIDHPHNAIEATRDPNSHYVSVTEVAVGMTGPSRGNGGWR